MGEEALRTEGRDDSVHRRGGFVGPTSRIVRKSRCNLLPWGRVSRHTLPVRRMIDRLHPAPALPALSALPIRSVIMQRSGERPRARLPVGNRTSNSIGHPR